MIQEYIIQKKNLSSTYITKGCYNIVSTLNHLNTGCCIQFCYNWYWYIVHHKWKAEKKEETKIFQRRKLKKLVYMRKIQKSLWYSHHNVMYKGFVRYILPIGLCSACNIKIVLFSISFFVEVRNPFRELSPAGSWRISGKVGRYRWADAVVHASMVPVVELEDHQNSVQHIILEMLWQIWRWKHLLRAHHGGV